MNATQRENCSPMKASHPLRTNLAHDEHRRVARTDQRLHGDMSLAVPVLCLWRTSIAILLIRWPVMSQNPLLPAGPSQRAHTLVGGNIDLDSGMSITLLLPRRQILLDRSLRWVRREAFPRKASDDGEFGGGNIVTIDREPLWVLAAAARQGRSFPIGVLPIAPCGHSRR